MGNRVDSTARETQIPGETPWSPIIVLVVALLFWAITNHWIAEDRRLFEFPHESALLATVIALMTSIAFYAVRRTRLSRICLGIGAVCLVVAVILWWELMTNSFGG